MNNISQQARIRRELPLPIKQIQLIDAIILFFEVRNKTESYYSYFCSKSYKVEELNRIGLKRSKQSFMIIQKLYKNQQSFRTNGRVHLVCQIKDRAIYINCYPINPKYIFLKRVKFCKVYFVFIFYFLTWRLYKFSSIF